MLWERCLLMAFILRKPSRPCQFSDLNLSGPRGALHSNALFQREKPQHVYSARFTARQLWDDAAKPKDTVIVAMWDDYLEADFFFGPELDSSGLDCTSPSSRPDYGIGNSK